MKTCCKCKAIKAESEFNKDASRKDGLQPSCRDCTKARGKKFFAEHPLRYVDKQKRYYEANKERVYPANRARYVKNTYGLSTDDLARMKESQGGVCAICKQAPTGKQGFCIDHNHVTGTVRGLLCPKCNTAIGLLKDSFIVAFSAGEYLKKICMMNPRKARMGNSHDFGLPTVAGKGDSDRTTDKAAFVKNFGEVQFPGIPIEGFRKYGNKVIKKYGN